MTAAQGRLSSSSEPDLPSGASAQSGSAEVGPAGNEGRQFGSEASAATSFDQRIDTMKLAYPNEADFIEALRDHSRTELVEQVVLYYRDAKRLYAGTVKP